MIGSVLFVVALVIAGIVAILKMLDRIDRLEDDVSSLRREVISLEHDFNKLCKKVKEKH